MKMGEEGSSTPVPNVSDDERDTSPFICGVVEGFYGRPWSTDQRKSLFSRMKVLGLNTYMYAPKDDFKHRAYWRELYSVEEAEQLSGLITAAKDNGIVFYYALSPGLDIVYSNPKEVACLRRKLEQVSQFGCEAFALLFDDIEPEISQTDKEVFQSFAQAQVSITNEVYQNLGQPKFLFCPTEYCSARAVPNVQNSDYLNTIGLQLMQGIDIMWTGTKVITKVLTVQSMRELSEVLRRQPVIWDNLHANDYDQKRVFLGPYSGRSTDLIPRLRGVLTNPNCEFECNYVAFHTIAQWSKCKSDATPELSEISADIRLETESESGSVEDIPSHLGPTTYHPKNALKLALREWLPEFYKQKAAFGLSGVVVPKELPLATVVANLSVPPPSLVAAEEEKDSSNGNLMSVSATPTGSIDSSLGVNFVPITKELANSLVDPPVILNPLLEPMDCNPSPVGSPKSTKSSDTPMDELKGAADKSEHEEMQTEPISVDDDNRLNTDDLSLLVDLFYLPFEHGSQGLQLLSEFQWLKSNGHLVSDYRKRKSVGKETPEVVEWIEKAHKFDEMNQAAGRLLHRLTFIRNRTLLYELYPYVWDVKGVISLLNGYVKWLGFSKGYKEAFVNGEQEPWLFRGGITGELQRLMPVESISDLFLYKPPDAPARNIYTIRPYMHSDESSVYEVCCKSVSLEESRERPTLIGDSLVGGYLCLSPEFCFVVEDENGICGYSLAALDTRQFEKKLQLAYLPELCSKYPAPNEKISRGEELTGSDLLIQRIHGTKEKSLLVPECVYKTYPSFMRFDLLSHVLDQSVAKRMMACSLAALKANGSTGVFLKGTQGDKNFVEFASKVGFQQVQVPIEEVLDKNDVYAGRTL